jgi:hypothetical protein
LPLAACSLAHFLNRIRALITKIKELNMPSIKAKMTIVNNVESSINIISSFSVVSKK